ncbi:MAG: hypothetical protein COA74_10325 [Gammaproteobacteria bacterium]|nr:MAG: hypothetical protein COA74_10325 [Gammaproteobacteria bacterium]
MHSIKRGCLGYIETCDECGGTVKVIACIENPAVIPKTFTAFMGQALDRILSYLKRQKSGQIINSNKSQISLLPEERAPPVDS